MQVLLLTKNHRQGKDISYAEILNRVRSGTHTANDCKVLQSRVWSKNHSDIPNDALYIICTTHGVNLINEAKLEAMNGECFTFKAEVSRSGQPYKNPCKSKYGSIFNTPLQMKLHLKVGAQIILTYNVDVMDLLINSTIGKVLGFEKTPQGTVKSISLQKQKMQKKKKIKSSLLNKKFLNTAVTPIDKT